MTKRIILTKEPIQITDGSKEVHLTISTGRNLKAFYAVSVNKPDKKHFHTFMKHYMNIPKGWSIWMWDIEDSSEEVIIAISEKTHD